MPATLLILIQNPIKALWFVLFILIFQQLDGNIIGPKILGNSTGLSSFWVLFAILLFGGLWGFVGMIIGVPLFAVIYDVVKKLVIHGLRRNDELEMLGTYHEAFGDPEEDIPAAPEAPAQSEEYFPGPYKRAAAQGFYPSRGSSFCVLLQLDDLQVFRHKQIAVEILPALGGVQLLAAGNVLILRVG